MELEKLTNRTKKENGRRRVGTAIYERLRLMATLARRAGGRQLVALPTKAKAHPRLGAVGNERVRLLRYCDAFAPRC